MMDDDASYDDDRQQPHDRSSFITSGRSTNSTTSGQHPLLASFLNNPSSSSYHAGELVPFLLVTSSLDFTLSWSAAASSSGGSSSWLESEKRPLLRNMLHIIDSALELISADNDYDGGDDDDDHSSTTSTIMMMDHGGDLEGEDHHCCPTSTRTRMATIAPPLLDEVVVVTNHSTRPPPPRPLDVDHDRDDDHGGVKKDNHDERPSLLQ